MSFAWIGVWMLGSDGAVIGPAVEHRAHMHPGERRRSAEEGVEPGDHDGEIEGPGAEAGDCLHAQLRRGTGRGVRGGPSSDRVAFAVG